MARVENTSERGPVSDLASVFKGGRIRGWVE